MSPAGSRRYVRIASSLRASFRMAASIAACWRRCKSWASGTVRSSGWPTTNCPIFRSTPTCCRCRCIRSAWEFAWKPPANKAAAALRPALRPTCWLNSSAGSPRPNIRPASRSSCTVIRNIGWDASRTFCRACWKRCPNSQPSGKRRSPSLPPGGGHERRCNCVSTATERTSRSTSIRPRRVIAVASNTGAANTRLPCRSTMTWYGFPPRRAWFSKDAAPRTSHAGAARSAHRPALAIAALLDWEKVTPVDEIGTHHWRGWVKRTLRRIRD